MIIKNENVINYTVQNYQKKHCEYVKNLGLGQINLIMNVRQKNNSNLTYYFLDLSVYAYTMITSMNKANKTL